MSYQVNFLDNQMVTAEALNSLQEELGGNVGDFQDDMVYGVDALNQISGSLIQKGVSRGCHLSASDGKVTIGPGVLFMEDGKRVEIDDDGITLDYTVGIKHYIWFMQEERLSFVLPRCTETTPEGSGSVLLGEILENGEISGRADKAVMRNSFLGLHNSETYTITYQWDPAQLEERLLTEIPLQDEGCQYVFAYCNEYAENVSKYHCFCGFVNLKNGEAYSVLSTYRDASESFNMGFPQAANSDGMLTVGLFPAVAWRYCFGHLRLVLGSDRVLRVYQSGTETSYGRGINSIPTNTSIQLIVC